MVFRKMRDFHCDVVNETVKIRLCNKPTVALKSQHTLFVMCDQSECQHVDNNKPPCPLNLSIFAQEVQAREESARLRKEALDYG